MNSRHLRYMECKSLVVEAGILHENELFALGALFRIAFAGFICREKWHVRITVMIRGVLIQLRHRHVLPISSNHTLHTIPAQSTTQVQPSKLKHQSPRLIIHYPLLIDSVHELTATCPDEH